MPIMIAMLLLMTLDVMMFFTFTPACRPTVIVVVMKHAASKTCKANGTNGENQISSGTLAQFFDGPHRRSFLNISLTFMRCIANSGPACEMANGKTQSFAASLLVAEILCSACLHVARHLY